MKHNALPILRKLSLLVLITLVVSACSPDNDDMSEPINYQMRYVGDWTCEEITGINAPQYYDIVIEPGQTSSDLIIRDIYTPGTFLHANFSELKLFIPTQTNLGITVNGMGNANADFEQIVVTLSATDGSSNEEIQVILRPKG
jgi:hypothetical protein